MSLKKFRKREEVAVQKDLMQLHMIKTQAIWDGGTHKRGKGKRHSLPYVLQRKTKGNTKKQACTDGRCQRDYIPKKCIASQTVANELVFIMWPWVQRN